MGENRIKNYPTIGCCGLDCGLCSRYYTVGSSRCPGCCGPDFFNKHPSCSYITCCVKIRKLEVCARCEEFPCAKFASWLTDGEEYDSFLTYKRAHRNLVFIRNHGVEKFIEQQDKRIKLLETIIKDFDDGRSKSFYCIAATLLPLKDIEAALNETEQKIKAEKAGLDGLKNRSQILKRFLNDFAAQEGIELKLRKKVRQ